MNGTGKTRYAEQLTRDAWRCVWFSPVPDYVRPGRTHASVAYLSKYRGLFDDPHARIVVDVQGEEGRDIALELRHLVKLMREATARKESPGGFVLVLDEVGDYAQSGDGVLKSLFRRCRHNGFAIVLVSQCATDIPLRCRKLATRVSTFGQEHEVELTEIEKVYGADYRAAVENWRPGAPPAEWRSRTFASRWSES